MGSYLQEAVSHQEDAFSEELSVPRPFVKWAGGKRQLVPELIKRLPSSFDTYFEPFLGGGALFFWLRPKKSVLSEINHELVNAYRIVKNHVFELIEDLEQHVHDEDYFYRMRNVDRLPEYDSWGAVKKASRLIYLNKTCYNGLYRVNSRGYFNVPFGDYSSPKIVDRENLIACSKALAQAKIFLDDFRRVERFVRKGDFVYFDPPYVPRSVTSSFTSYTDAGFDRDLHEELRDLCIRLTEQGVHFLLTNSDTEFSRELYRQFRVEDVDAALSINSKGDGRGKVKDLIVRNYE